VSDDRDALAVRLAEVYLVVGPLYRKVLRAVDRDQPVMGMPVGVRAVLDQLRREGPRTVPAMAREQDLSRQFVQRMVHHAADGGWVRSVPNPEHRRSQLIRLTAAGEGAIDAVHAREHALLRDVDGGLTAADVTATLRVLRAMEAALDRVERRGAPSP
jgi:DNA-binding MarR family transcriptional regulator